MRTSILLIAVSFALPAWGAKFANQFVEFELPAKWKCNLEGAEWVCQSLDSKKRRDAIIILAAKLRGKQDSLDQYLAYLKKPKIYTSVQGKPVKSEAKYAKTINVNQHPWVDSMHLESEVPGFYTRYLATIKKDIGVLVTYSIDKVKYQRYLGQFESMVKTLKVFRKSGGLNAAPAKSNIFQNTTIPTEITQETVFPGATPDFSDSGKKKKSSDEDDTFFLMLLGLGVLIFIIWRRRRSGG